VLSDLLGLLSALQQPKRQIARSVGPQIAMDVLICGGQARQSVDGAGPVEQAHADEQHRAAIEHALAGRTGPSLSTSGETLTIEESMTLRARTENAGDVGDEHEWSWGC
jgi:hypothetical protein